MSMKCSLIVPCLLLCITVQADEEKPKKPEQLSLIGVFEAVQASELKFTTKHLSALKLKKIVPHGTTVKKGQTIVWVDTEEFDRQIRTAEQDLRLAKLTLDETEFDFEQFKVTQQLDRAAAERTRRAAQQTWDNYVQVDKDRNVETTEYNLKSSQASLENAMEELKQLEQMYKEDELTEESEEIVLKRARRSVEGAQFRLKGAEIQAERSLKQSLPRQHAQQEETLKRAEMAYQKSVRSLNTARQKKDIEISRARESYQRQETKLSEMKSERKSLVIIAPHDGIVFHGSLTRGKLSDKAVSHKEGTAVTAGQVVATLANPAQLQIRVDLNEAQHSNVNAGMTGKAVANAYADTSVTVVVKSVAQIPYANAKFDCVMSVRGKNSEIVPGTSGIVKLAPPK